MAVSTDHLFTVDFSTLPDGPLHGNHPRPNLNWHSSTGADGGFIITSPSISDGALVNAYDDFEFNGPVIYARADGDLYLPVYPEYVPQWGGGIGYADAGELEIYFTLPARGHSWADSSRYMIGLGCVGTPNWGQPWMDIGVDETTNMGAIQCRFAVNVTPYSIPAVLADAMLLFGGATNIARISWTNSEVRWHVNGETVYVRAGYYQPSRNPSVRVWPGARITRVATGPNPVPPITTPGYWMRRTNVTEAL